MDAETWFNTEEALEFGLIDEITDQLEIAAIFDPTKFQNVPDYILKEFKNMATATVDKQAVLDAEKKRRTDIRELFARHNGFDELQNACLDDPAIDTAKAGKMLLAELGKTMNPLVRAIHVLNMSSIPWATSEQQRWMRY